MSKNTKTTIGIIIIILIIGGIWYGVSREPKEEGVIKIGFVAPLSGDAATYGEFVMKAFKLAIENFNAENNKISFDVIYEDGQCDGKTAVTAINKLISIDKIKYILGGLCSSETLSMAPIAETNKVILFSPGSGSPDITNAGDYIFRNLASDDCTAKEIAKVALQNGDNKIVIISENLDYPQTLKKAFVNYYLSQGGEILLDEMFTSGTTDFRTIITKIKNQNINTIYLIPQTYKTADLILKQMKELGFSPKIYTNEAAVNQEALDYYGASYKGLLEEAILTQPKFDEDYPKSAEMLSKFKAKYGSTQGPLPASYLATYYDSVYLLGEAIQKAGNNTESVKNYFYGIKDWQGAIGNFSFDINGDAVTDVEVKTIKNGEIISYISPK
jgi:branched-chain amino acid transport system substrate-binding protein